MSALGDRIRKVRKARGWSQAELSELTSISRSAIGSMETGRYNPTDSTIALIAKALDTPVAELIGRTKLQRSGNGHAKCKVPEAPEVVDDGWVTWKFGVRRPRDNAIVRVKLRNGTEMEEKAYRFRWDKQNVESDILSYRIVKLTKPVYQTPPEVRPVHPPKIEAKPTKPLIPFAVIRVLREVALLAMDGIKGEVCIPAGDGYDNIEITIRRKD